MQTAGLDIQPTMARPYLKKSIRELEQIYVAADGDQATLRMLREELRHRRTQRAAALRSKVAAAVKSGVLEGAGANPHRRNPNTRQGAANASAGRRESAPSVGSSGSTVSRPATPPSSTDKAPESDRPVGDSSLAVPTESLPAQRGAAGPELDEPATPDLEAPASRPRQTDPAVSVPDTDALLAAWITLEVLEPQPLPKPEELGSLGRQLVRSEEHPEPWTDAAHRARNRESGVYWFVLLGELDLAAALSSLLELFPDQSPEKPGRVKGTTTMAVVVLDAAGRPAQGRTFLSSFAWGYGKVRAGELQTLVEFSEAERRICDELEKKLIRMDEDGEVLPATADDLERITGWLLRCLRLPAEEVSIRPVSIRVPVWGRTFEAPEPELLNSFFLEDLARVRAAFRTGDVGAALRQFLGGRPPRSPADVVREPRLLEETLSPGRIPLSRWPPRGRHPLVLMQQAAVNHTVHELAGPGLAGINGPPGTGKTTLLRDVVAKVVLDRSIALAAFQDPQEAFSHVATMASGRGYLHLYRLDESLLGHEVVVASSNNKAVENISREIPALDAIANDLEPPLRYFSSIADLLLQEGTNQEHVQAGAAWGLVAAVLGNAANRSRFVNAFWWHPERSMQKYLRSIVEGWNPGTPDSDPEDRAANPPEVTVLEGAPTDRAEALARWRKAQERFRRARNRCESLRRELENVRQALHARSSTEESLQAVHVEIETLRDRLAEVAREAAAAADLLDRVRRRRTEAAADRAAHRSLRPGFLARLFGTRRYRDWRDRMEAKVAAVEAATVELRAAEVSWEAAREMREEVESRTSRRERDREELEGRLAEIRSVLAAAQAELGERLPDRRFWSRAEEDRQKLSPWLGERFQVARDDLFAACFELHRAFVDAAAPRLRHNLGAAMQLLKGRKLSERQEPARRSLWASLFLVIPVVSTTFASVSRMFGPLGREGLGWLLIDEAGQTVPQAATGAIWRSQRTVAIGDPMQIPPVVSMPPRLIDAILSERKVDPEAWAAPRNSVQTLADRSSWFGTTLRHAEGDLWVGSPLRVHRRCEEPMFRISNLIAYDGLMVQATPPAESAIGDVLGESGWFHVEGGEPGHWSPAEGELAARLLSAVLERCPDEPDIFFITPFRIVQAQLRRRLHRVVAQQAELTPWQWVRENVGTIHTFQGREAEAVALVLGAPSPQAVGARRWAGGEPNLLNVAVSRAKRRLYVIGDRRSWRDAGVFRVLAANLPEKPPMH